MIKSRGFSLVELMATMSTATVLLALATGLVHRTMRFESLSQQRASAERTAARLAHDFRRDVHHAHNTQVSEQDQLSASIRIVISEGGDVTYRATKHRVLREQRLNARQVAREIYDFPEDHQVSFSRPSPRMAVLHVEHQLELIGVAPQHVVHVEAEIGRLHRLIQAAKEAP